MTNRILMAAGASALALCGVASVGVLGGFGAAQAGSRDAAKLERKAEGEARKAVKAAAKGNAGVAMFHAEAAVGYSPMQARYRLVLGQVYLKAGRFSSARQAFADALALSPGDGKAALNLALTEIAGGDWAKARETLDRHAGAIPAADRGLAMALAGDPAAGVGVLVEAVRAPGAGVKARQNLALAYALAGQWQQAKTMAAIDLPPAEVDARIMAWAKFARPVSAFDQVASLLGVRAVQDPGFPVRLALNTAPATSPNVGLASAAPVEVVPAPQPVAVAAVDVAPVAQPVAEADVAVAAAPVASVSFGPRREIVQTLPERVSVRPAVKAKAYGIARPDAAMGVMPAKISTRAKAATATSFSAAKGNYFVQFGAYENAAVARDAWGRITRRNAALGNQTPMGMAVKNGNASFYRLSVGGFARNDADALCRKHRASGGACFVRTSAGEQPMNWGRASGR